MKKLTLCALALSIGQGVITGSAVQAQAKYGVTTPGFGEALPGLSAADKALFAAGLEEFNTPEEPDEGLGPVFNGDSCASCHAQGAIGGAGTLVETRFGRVTNGVFDPLAQYGGSLIQTTGIGREGNCNFVGETVPKTANVVAGRLTTPLFGLGLIDAIPAANLETVALLQPLNVRGRTNKVTEIATGKTVVGKFGWKAQVPTVFQFAGDAYLNEMGITSPQFPTENCPGGNCALLACDPIPEKNGVVEDAGDGVQAFADFMTMLAAPPTGPANLNTIAGQLLFNTVGCASCHTPSQTTGVTARAATSKKTFWPYSDFLLHDMGASADGIGGQGRATMTEMRTAPLWGARVRTKFWHDGRASNVNDAIVAHDGQGKTSRVLYQLLLPFQRSQIVAFINSL